MKTMHLTDIRKRASVLIVLLLCQLLASAATAETTVRATVDRQQLGVDETLKLTVSADSMSFSDEPDADALEKDFHVLNRQQSSRSSFINGKVSSSRNWDYTLAPKRQGNLTIPALSVGKYKTRPISISVSAAPQRQATGSEQVYLESNVTPRRAYVQSELQYSIKIFTSVNFLEASLEPLEVDGAVVQEGDEDRYQTTINGRFYQVIERHYRLYPQRSGELDIPALTLQARVEGYRQSMLDPGRLVVKRSSQAKVQVMPPASSFDGPVWLPAKALSISDAWSQSLDTIKVGDSVTRSINIQADGLLGSQLPALPTTQLEHAKLYPDQAIIEDPDSGDWTGTRQESLAIIPTKPGEYLLPELRIPWWNTETDQQEVAVLPERRFTVLPAPGTTAASRPETASTDIAQPNNDAEPTSTALTAPLPSNPLWVYAVLAASLFGNLIFAILWWRGRNLKETTVPTPKPADAEAEAFKKLKKACKSPKDHQALREALLHWANATLPAPISLSELANRCPDLAPYCQALDAQLYAINADPADFQGLVAAVESSRKSLQGPNTRNTKAGLPPLYSQ